MKKDLLSYMLPEELLEHFNIVSVQETGDASQAQGVLSASPKIGQNIIRE